MSEEPGCSMKPYPFELLNHLTLPVILDITTNPPNDSVKRATAGEAFARPRLKLVSRDALLEAQRGNTTKKKCMVKSADRAIHHAHLRGLTTKHITVKLVNRKTYNRF